MSQAGVKFTFRQMSDAEAQREALACERGYTPLPWADLTGAADMADGIWSEECARIGLFDWNIHLLTIRAEMVLRRNVRHRLRAFDAEPEFQRAVKVAHFRRWGHLAWERWFRGRQIAKLVAADVDPGVPLAINEWPEDLLVMLDPSDPVFQRLGMMRDSA